MIEYHKIPTLFNRATDGGKKLIYDDWRDEAVHYLANNRWEFTEKVDGTSISVHWDGHEVAFHGRTERAQIPAELVNKLNELFGGEVNAQMFEQVFGEKEVILYGEGFGRKIQNGGNYIPDGVDFILFDVYMPDGNWWLRRFDVENIAQQFGIRHVPVVGRGTLYDAIEFVKSKPDSTIGTAKMEGVVCRPAQELFDRSGKRIIVKVKVKDFE